jgi:hypothetical protein
MVHWLYRRECTAQRTQRIEALEKENDEVKEEGFRHGGGVEVGAKGASYECSLKL